VSPRACEPISIAATTPSRSSAAASRSRAAASTGGTRDLSSTTVTPTSLPIPRIESVSDTDGYGCSESCIVNRHAATDGLSAAETTSRPVVPLEAGAGPENPPCPACGEPLFGWIDERPGLAGAVKRCESCGLGVAGAPASAEEALAELDRRREGETLRIANRAGFAAWLGGAGWAGLEPGRRYLFTPESVRRLVARRDQVVKTARWSPGAGVATMWQTVLNGFTFGRNVALAALGRGTAVPAERPWQRRLDAVISVVVAIPALLVAVPLELGAAAVGRGAALSLRLELL